MNISTGCRYLWIVSGFGVMPSPGLSGRCTMPAESTGSDFRHAQVEKINTFDPEQVCSPRSPTIRFKAKNLPHGDRPQRGHSPFPRW